MMIVIVTGSSFLKASEIQSEYSEIQSEIVDLTSLSNDELAKKLDQNPQTQDFIILNEKQLQQVKGYNVTEIIANESLSKVNPTMWGNYEIFKVNGNFVFCIEPGLNTLSIANSVGVSGSVYKKFSSTTKTHISRIISSAYGKYDQTNKVEYIFAGQLLIWEYLSAHEEKVIGNPLASWNPGFLKSWTIRNSIYNPQIKVIEDDVVKWSVLPSFLGSNTSTAKGHVLKYDKAKDEFSITLTDTKHVWDAKYANYKQVGGYQIKNIKGSDNVKVSISTQQLAYSNPIGFKWTPSFSTNKQVYDAGQDLITVGAPPISGYMKFKTEPYPKGGFELKKVGQQPDGNPVALSGVKFKVTGTDFKKVYTTNKNGQISVASELSPGKYQIEEVSAPSKYVVNFKQSFTVKSSEITKINAGNPIKNELYYNRIKFTKNGESHVETTDIPLSGVVFAIYKEGGEPNQIIDDKDQLIAELTSNKDGIVVSDKLYEGAYIISEVTTNEGYVLSDQTYSFSVTNTSEIASGTQVDLGSFTNKLIKGQVQLQKIGVGSCQKLADCSIPLSSVKFEIYCDENENGELDQDEMEAVTQVITDQDGNGLSEFLKYGHYVLKEVENPHNNYQLTDTQYPFEITAENQIVEINDGMPIQNSEKTGSIEISKSGESRSNNNQDLIPLAETTYRITDEHGELVSDVTTDTNGVANLDNLSFGIYNIQEQIAPEGYDLDKSSFQFTINEKNYSEPIKLKFTDELIKNKIEISKIDKEDSKQLAGAELTIIDRESKAEVMTWTTTLKPNSIILNYGQYEVCEKKAPAGYKLSNKCKKFDVTANNQSQQFAIVNKKIKMYTTGSTDKKILFATILIIILVFLTVIRYRLMQA